MASRNEVTGAQVAKIAGRTMRRIARTEHRYVFFGTFDITTGKFIVDINPACSVEELAAVNGSVLTQTKDRTDRRKAKRK